VAVALDAAYRYDCFLWNEATNRRYNFSKHKSDWIDCQLLYYLCDHEMYLVVHDTQLQNRIAGSPQSGRVLPYGDFLKLATTGAPFRVRAPSP
jgi:hypothetical protein